jgi:YgiT-type zinc finger domain-containing protein
MKTEGMEHAASTQARSAPHCPVCGHDDVRTTLTRETFTYGVGEKAAQITVTVPLRTCAKCGYQYTDDEAEDIRHEAVCHHLGVLTPSQIVALREQSRLVGAALADLVRTDEATIACWERGAVIQDGPADQLLYLLQFGENVQRLRERAEKEMKQRGGPTTTIMKPQLDGRAWLGKADFYGTTFFVELFESRRDPGYYHYTMYCADDSFLDESKRPIRAKDEVGISFWTLFAAVLSKEHNLLLNELHWVEVTAEDLPLSGERVKAGA